MRGATERYSNDAEAVVRAYKAALEAGKTELAEQIKKANPDLAARLQ